MNKVTEYVLNALGLVLPAVARRVQLNRFRALPVTDDAVEALIVEVCEASDIPVNPSTRQAVAMMIQGVLQHNMTITLGDLVREMARGRCNQAAYNVIQASRKEQAAAKDDNGPEAT